MEERFLRFLESEQLTSSKFADVIGVQRSSVSHVLAGRNKPSFDFLQKTLKAFPMLNASWLILGDGVMYHDKPVAASGTLFDHFQERDSGKGSSARGNEFAGPGSMTDQQSIPPTGSSQAEDRMAQQEIRREAGNLQTADQSGQGEKAGELERIPRDDMRDFNEENLKEFPESGLREGLSDHAGKSAERVNKRISRVIIFYSDRSFESFEHSS